MKPFLYYASIGGQTVSFSPAILYHSHLLQSKWNPLEFVDCLCHYKVTLCCRYILKIAPWTEGVDQTEAQKLPQHLITLINIMFQLDFGLLGDVCSYTFT